MAETRFEASGEFYFIHFMNFLFFPSTKTNRKEQDGIKRKSTHREIASCIVLMKQRSARFMDDLLLSSIERLVEDVRQFIYKQAYERSKC